MRTRAIGLALVLSNLLAAAAARPVAAEPASAAHAARPARTLQAPSSPLQAEPSPGARVLKPPAYVQRLALPSQGEQLSFTRGVTADRHTGEVFVLDLVHNRVLVFDEDGLFRFDMRGGQIFRAPLDLAVSPEGFLVLLAGHGSGTAMLVLDFDGALLGKVRLTGLPPGTAEPQPISLALSEEGKTLYVVDQANHRLWISDIHGRVRRGVDLAAHEPPEKIHEQILGKADVYGDTVLVAIPTAGRIALYSLEGEPRGQVGLKGTAPCQSAFPVAAAMDAQGHVIILDKQRTLVMIWLPEDNRCLVEFSGIGNAPGFLYEPTDITLDAQGRLYISQGFEGRVQVFQHAAPAAGRPGASSPEVGGKGPVSPAPRPGDPGPVPPPPPPAPAPRAVGATPASTEPLLSCPRPGFPTLKLCAFLPAPVLPPLGALCSPPPFPSPTSEVRTLPRSPVPLPLVSSPRPAPPLPDPWRRLGAEDFRRREFFHFFTFPS